MVNENVETIILMQFDVFRKVSLGWSQWTDREECGGSQRGSLGWAMEPRRCRASHGYSILTK